LKSNARTEACTLLEVQRPARSCDARRTDAAVVARIRELAPDHTDVQIASVLNAEGWPSGLQGDFTKSKVQWVRYAHAISTGCPDAPTSGQREPRGDGRYSTQAAAALLNVDISTIAAWCDQGRLDSLRSTPRGPRGIHLTPEIVAALGKPERQRWNRSGLSAG